jgi:hypothetical protein
MDAFAFAILAALKLTYIDRSDKCHAWAWALYTAFSLALISVVIDVL